jgi:hypothetical protein
MAEDRVLPKLERRLDSFLKDERGSISKQSVISVGSILAASATLASLARPVAGQQPGCQPDHSNNVGHTNSMALSETPSGLTTSHSNSDPFHCNHQNSPPPSFK